MTPDLALAAEIANVLDCSLGDWCEALCLRDSARRISSHGFKSCASRKLREPSNITGMKLHH